mgnify:CR=1 FL=1
MRMIGEIVSPSVILLGEVVMEPVKVVPYFGTVEKPECHLLYNVTTMCTTWHTVATQDTRLLRRQLDIVNSLPKEYVFLNYLRCHEGGDDLPDHPHHPHNGVNLGLVAAVGAQLFPDVGSTTCAVTTTSAGDWTTAG